MVCVSVILRVRHHGSRTGPEVILLYIILLEVFGLHYIVTFICLCYSHEDVLKELS